MDDSRLHNDPGDPPPTDAPSVAVRDARPATDVLAMEAVRARVERALFGAASRARLGRYEVIDRIAGGGMGVVYRAEDPELRRKVALKVLYPRQLLDENARKRMLVEARALAKLDHPNVVKIHDVLALEGQTVIVMELVEGVTLAAWERGEPRSWREIVRAYAQAGDGLAAAHELDIVHRDFKPANAVIRGDGRVSVLDFGLARVVEVGDEPALALGSTEPPAQKTTNGLTSTGEIVGTIGYSSPEQLSGTPATQASDQFSFCVALHRAIEGVPPFAGADAASLLQDIRTGVIHRTADGRSVPGWLRAVLARGLAYDPGARFPSMAALLIELRRRRGWRRWSVPSAVAATVAAFAVVVASRPSSGISSLHCDGGASEIDPIWGSVQRRQLEVALGSIDSPYLRSIRGQLFAGLDAYRGRWIELHRDACTQQLIGTQSPTLKDRRMGCLRRRLSDIAASIEVIGRVDRSTAASVLDVVARLPALDACSGVERLLAEAPPSGTQRPWVDDVRTSLARAAALDRGGRSVPARDLAATAVSSAERIGYAPLIAEAALLYGTILLRREEFAAATGPLFRARNLALGQHLFALAVEAGARQLYVEAKQDNRRADLLRDAELLEPISRGLVDDHFARPLLLNNIGVMHQTEGNRKAARDAFERARDALKGAASPDIELTCIDKNLAMLTPDPVERRRLVRSVWERRRDVLGEHHLSTIGGLDSYARYEDDPSVAYELIAATCMGYDVYHPELLESRAYCNSYRAFLLEYQGNEWGALTVYGEIADLVAGHPDPEVSSWGRLATGHSQRLAGHAAEAIGTLSSIAREFADSRDWWVMASVADAERGIGLAERARGRATEAGAHLLQAATLYDKITTRYDGAEFRLRGAFTRRAAEAR